MNKICNKVYKFVKQILLLMYFMIILLFNNIIVLMMNKVKLTLILNLKQNKLYILVDRLFVTKILLRELLIFHKNILELVRLIK